MKDALEYWPFLAMAGLFTFVIAQVYLYDRKRIDSNAEAIAQAHAGLMRLEQQMGRFMAHEESERGTRARENERFNKRLDAIEERTQQTNIKLAEVIILMASINTELHHRNEQGG